MCDKNNTQIFSELLSDIQKAKIQYIEAKMELIKALSNVGKKNAKKEKEEKI